MARGLSEKRTETERSLAKQQSKLQVGGRLDTDKHGSSTARYLEERAMKVFDSAGTSSPDSKDLDQRSNSSLALSYGNLELSKRVYTFD